MTYRQPFVLLAAVCMALVAGSTLNTLMGQNQPGPQPVSVAVVDVQKVFAALDQKTAVEQQISTRAQQLQQEQEQRQQEIKNLQADLAILSPESDAYQQTRLQLEEMAIQYQAWQQFMQVRLEREKAQQIESLYHTVVDAVQRLAQDAGYDLVLYNDQSEDLGGDTQKQLAALIQVRKVLYAAEALDITDQVTQMLNNEYNTQAGQAQ